MNAHDLTRALGGTWYGRYGTARCPAHGDERPSLSLSDGPDGRLLAKCHAGCAFGSIMDALRDLGVIVGQSPGPRRDPAEALLRRAEAKADLERRSAQAKQIWDEADPITGTVAERYLRGRGITCPLPETLRFHPACWHLTAKRLPALLAIVEGSEGSGVHRTYLRDDGSGKAVVEPQKAMLGCINGGAVRLTAAGQPLVVAEGIETALSFASGLLAAPATIWAALSTAGMRALKLPLQPGQLTIAIDGDRAGREAATVLARRADGEGWQVSLLNAPDGQDWNDVLNPQAAG